MLLTLYAPHPQDAVRASCTMKYQNSHDPVKVLWLAGPHP